jgi:hypothetical protein
MQPRTRWTRFLLLRISTALCYSCCLFRSLFSLVALKHLCVDLCRQDEVSIENLYAADLVPLHDVNLATKRTVVYPLLDPVLWPGLPVLKQLLSLVSVDYCGRGLSSFEDDACWATLLPPRVCPLFGGRATFASINYFDQSVQKNNNLVCCDVISTWVRRTPRAFVPPCSDSPKCTWKGPREFSALDPAIPYRTWRR